MKNFKNWNWRWIAGTALYAFVCAALLTLLCHFILDQHPWLPGVIVGTVFSTLFTRVMPLLLERRLRKRNEAYARVINALLRAEALVRAEAEKAKHQGSDDKK